MSGTKSQTEREKVSPQSGKNTLNSRKSFLCNEDRVHNSLSEAKYRGGAREVGLSKSENSEK